MPDPLRPHGLHSRWNSPDQNMRVGSHSLLQGILHTQESNQGLLYCRRILYQLSYQESPIARQAHSLATGFPRQEYWSGLPFPPPGDLSNPGIETGSPALKADSFPGLSHHGSPTVRVPHKIHTVHPRWAQKPL